MPRFTVKDVTQMTLLVDPYIYTVSQKLLKSADLSSSYDR